MKLLLGLLVIGVVTAHWTHDDPLAREIGSPPAEEDVDVAAKSDELISAPSALLQTNEGDDQKELSVFEPWNAATNTYYEKKDENARCQSSTATTGVANQAACQAAAVTAVHNFYNFKPGTSQCQTSASCNSYEGGDSTDWEIYRRWKGSSTDWKVDSDLALRNAETPYTSNGCETHDLAWPHAATYPQLACTSCQEGHAFMMIHHQSRVGKCQPYTAIPRTVCVGLDMNGAVDISSTKNILCTKALSDTSELTIGALSGNAAEYYSRVGTLYFNDALNMDRALAICQIRKEVICDAGVCTVRKFGACQNVCRLRHYPAFAHLHPEFEVKNGFSVDHCDPTVCTGGSDNIVRTGNIIFLKASTAGKFLGAEGKGHEVKALSSSKGDLQKFQISRRGSNAENGGDLYGTSGGMESGDTFDMMHLASKAVVQRSTEGLKVRSTPLTVGVPTFKITKTGGGAIHAGDSVFLHNLHSADSAIKVTGDGTLTFGAQGDAFIVEKLAALQTTGDSSTAIANRAMLDLACRTAIMMG